VLALYCGYFYYTQAKKRERCCLSSFPAGPVLFRELCDYIVRKGTLGDRDVDDVFTFTDTSPGEELDELIVTNGLPAIIEAVWILQSPVLLRDIINSKYVLNVHPRVAHVALRTLFSLPSPDSVPDSGLASLPRLTMRRFESSMKLVEGVAVRQLASGLRINDGLPADLCHGRIPSLVILLESLQRRGGTFYFLQRLWEDAEPGLRLLQHAFVIRCMVVSLKRAWGMTKGFSANALVRIPKPCCSCVRWYPFAT